MHQVDILDVFLNHDVFICEHNNNDSQIPIITTHIDENGYFYEKVVLPSELFCESNLLPHMDINISIHGNIIKSTDDSYLLNIDLSAYTTYGIFYTTVMHEEIRLYTENFTTYSNKLVFTGNDKDNKKVEIEIIPCDTTPQIDNSNNLTQYIKSNFKIL